MPDDRVQNEFEYMATGILLGALLGFLLFVVLKNFTLGIGIGVGLGLILSDVIYRRKSELSS
jgi:hypothetical protein